MVMLDAAVASRAPMAASTTQEADVPSVVAVTVIISAGHVRGVISVAASNCSKPAAVMLNGFLAAHAGGAEKPLTL
jgi:hypothetical protein